MTFFENSRRNVLFILVIYILLFVLAIPIISRINYLFYFFIVISWIFFSILAYIFIFSSNFSFDLVDIDYSYQILLAGFIIGLALNFTSTFSLSEDVYRYLFDGFLIQKNINPYLTAPSMISTSITSQFPFYALINNPEVSSPYPPLSIAFSYIYVVLFGFNPIGWLIVINLVTTLTGFILIKILKYLDINKHVIILWSLNPNILFDFNSSGHNDIFTILFLSLSIYFLIRKSENQNVWLIVAGLCFSFSIGLKLFTFLMFPFLIKWFKKSGSFIVILLTSLQFFVFYVLINLNFSGIVIFLKYWRFNGGLFELFYFIFNDFNSSVNNLFLESNLRIIFALIFILSYFIIIVILKTIYLIL